MEVCGHEFFMYREDSIREDKKCGNSGIPENAVCTKQRGGVTTKKQKKSKRKRPPRAVGFAITGAAGAATLALAAKYNKEREGRPGQKRLMPNFGAEAWEEFRRQEQRGRGNVGEGDI